MWNYSGYKNATLTLLFKCQDFVTTYNKETKINNFKRFSTIKCDLQYNLYNTTNFERGIIIKLIFLVCKSVHTLLKPDVNVFRPITIKTILTVSKHTSATL